jgi:CheY-like chemotaxis protein
MNGIIGFTNLLKEEDLSPEEIENYFEIIEDSSTRLLKLINDLVDISKIEAKQVEIQSEKTNLNKLMDDIFNFFSPQARQKKIQFTYSKGLKGSDAHILIDKFKLQQILSNIISNALKFTKEGSIHLSYVIENNHLVFSVKDTGIGIKPGMENVIFERFRQAENTYLKETEGSGLGLSISKSFVELMGGNIWVESEYGKGSVFSFKIPFQLLSNMANKPSKKTEHSFDKEITVLIAEDDEVSYLFLKKMLVKNNFKILHAKNGKQAVQFFKKNPKVGIILMDLKMPLMNGIDATYQIRKLNPKIPIIAQTAYASDIDKQRAFHAGCNDFITKPVQRDILFEKMGEALGIENV